MHTPDGILMYPVAHIRSDFPTKFGIPKQSGLSQALEARVVFCPEYRSADAVRGLEEFSHIWLLWQFSAAVRRQRYSLSEFCFRLFLSVYFPYLQTHKIMVVYVRRFIVFE